MSKTNDFSKFISRKINGRGFDMYKDGTLKPWADGNAAFDCCEATGDVQCHVPVSALREAISSAEKELGAQAKHGTLIPGDDELCVYEV